MQKRVASATVVMAMAVTLSGCGLKKAIIHKALLGKAVSNFLDIDNAKTQDKIMSGCGKDLNLDMSNITEYIKWPGCTGGVPKGCTGECAKYGLAFQDGKFACPKNGCVHQTQITWMSKFNKKHGGHKVSYPSRPGKGKDGKPLEDVTLTGWWLPAPNASSTTPRIVIQHGMRSNSNHMREQFVAYILRKLGYSVLINNLRDHCYSGQTKSRTVQWGHAYPYDVLGAWDAAVAGPGDAGKIDTSKVGIIGISMGAFLTSTAFGLEGDIPAVWTDSAPLTPRSGFVVVFKREIKKLAKIDALGTFLGNHISDDLWAGIEAAALKRGVDLQENTPAKTLPEGPDSKRPVFITYNKQDTTIGIADGHAYATLYTSQSRKYSLQKWFTDEKCGALEIDPHCLAVVIHTEDYAAKLDNFWRGVFDNAPQPAKLYQDSQQQQTVVSHLGASATSTLIGICFVSVAMVLIVLVRRARASSLLDLPLDVDGAEASADGEE